MRGIRRGGRRICQAWRCISPVRTVATAPSSRYIQMKLNGKIMRAEVQNIVEEIKQSVGLLRRHL
jgi:hypothetical protein